MIEIKNTNNEIYLKIDKILSKQDNNWKFIDARDEYSMITVVFERKKFFFLTERLKFELKTSGVEENYIVVHKEDYNDDYGYYPLFFIYDESLTEKIRSFLPEGKKLAEINILKNL